VNDLVRFALAAFFPRVGELPGLAELDLDRKVTKLRREATWLVWFGIVLAALVFQLTPILTVRRPWPAAFLTELQLDEHAHRIASHPAYLLRQLMVLLKLNAGILWGESPEVRAFIQLPAYPPDPGTRRTEPVVAPYESPARAPVEALVTLGRREEERGRQSDQKALEEGRVV